MAIEVLLMQTMENLGQEGEVVKVADGYARNYLYPRQLAAPVTEATRRQLVKLQREREAARLEARAEADALAAKLSGASVTLAMKTSDGEALYGSVSSADIAAELKTQGFEVERGAIEIPEPIKELGVFEIKVRLAPEAVATIKVWVVEE